MLNLFPEAQFICVYRQCLDVVQSCMEVFYLGFPGRLGEYVARRPANKVEALVESWNDGPPRRSRSKHSIRSAARG